MVHETLKVDTERLAQAAAQLGMHADDIPTIPPGFSVSGSDPLSSAIAAQVPKLEEPVIGA